MKTTIEKQPENIVKVDIEVPAKDASNEWLEPVSDEDYLKRS